MSEKAELNRSHKIEALLGFALKSNSICKGMDSIAKEVARNNIGLVFELQKVSENTHTKLDRLLSRYRVPLVKYSDQTFLEKCGLKRCKLLGVKHGALSDGLLQLLKQEC